MFCSSCGAVVSESASSCMCGKAVAGHSTGSPAIIGVYSGFWRRVLAACIDNVICAVVNMVVGGVAGGMLGAVLGAKGTDINTVKALGTIIGLFVGVVCSSLYFTLQEASAKQATIGKRAVGVAVTTVDGARISFAQANGRYFGKGLSAIILCIGFIMVAFTQKKQGLHDILAGTVVVKRRG